MTRLTAGRAGGLLVENRKGFQKKICPKLYSKIWKNLKLFSCYERNCLNLLDLFSFFHFFIFELLWIFWLLIKCQANCISNGGTVQSHFRGVSSRVRPGGRIKFGPYTHLLKRVIFFRLHSGIKITFYYILLQMILIKK